MLIKYGFDITVEVFQPTPVLLRLDVHPDRRFDITGETGSPVFTPIVRTDAFDAHGNIVRRLKLVPGTARFTLEGTIMDSGQPEAQITTERAIDPSELPGDTLQYTVASRYCEIDLLSEFAWAKFGALPTGGQRVRAIVDYVHDHLQFGYQFARNTRSAVEAHNERVGVCRDFAHLTIALCRCLNIPARYVNGYLGDIGVPVDPAPMDFSAWVEVYLDGKWFTVDARHNHARIGRIVIARGRDATDVPMIHTFAPHVLRNFSVTCVECAQRLQRAA